MKKSYLFVPAPAVVACKEIARAIIKYGLALDFPSYEDLLAYSVENSGIYADLISGFLDCWDGNFYNDFEEWIKHEIIKIYRHERKNRHES